MSSLSLTSIGGNAGATTLIVSDPDNRVKDRSHPWAITIYSKIEGGWIIVINPGFVNGIDPLANSYDEKKKSSPVKIGLCAQPEIKIYQFDEPKIFLPFFVARGAKKSAAGISASGEVLTINVTSVPSNTEQRDLLQCQVWLEQARSTLSIAVDMPGNLITGDLVDYTATYNFTALRALGNRPIVRTGGTMPDKKVKTLEEILSGDIGDGGIDRILLATVYFLSQDYNSPIYSAKLDTSWIPYVVHNCFWNLSYQAKNLIPTNIKPNTLDPSLAFFLGRYVFPGAIIGATNALESQIINELNNSHDNSGYFYTS